MSHAGILAVLALGACAPRSEAALITFGSSLSAGAEVVQARTSDTVYWQTAPAPGGTTAAAPASGQIRSFRVKGFAMSRPRAGVPGGETDFHLQALRAQPNGAFENWTYRVLVTSGNFNVPTQAQGASSQTVTTYEPVNFCVTKGDALAFNTVGGWDGTTTGPYASGTPLQIFASAPGALVSQFNGADQTNNGAVFKPDLVRGRNEELLMQLTLATGSDSSGLCPPDAPPGGAAPPPGSGSPGGAGSPGTAAPRATITSKRVSLTRKGSLSVALFCKVGTGSSCAGTVSVLVSGRVLATKSYAIGPANTRKVTLRLSSAGRRQFARAKQRLRVRIQTVTQPGGTAGTVTKAFTLRRRGA